MSTRSKKSRKSHREGRDYLSPQEKQTPASCLAVAQISAFKSQIPYRKTFRFNLTAGVGIGTPWTTAMFLDMYAIAIGGTTTPVRIYNAMKLIGVKMWGGPGNVGEGGSFVDTIAVEFSPSLIAGFGGAPRSTFTSTSLSTAKYAHICAKPKKDELAAQWFTGQQGVYTLMNISAGAATVIQFDFLVMEVNGETPVATVYNTSLAKGTIGVTNFGVAGCRGDGLENLVNP